MHIVEWRLTPFEGAARELWPLVDGLALRDVVQEYESNAGYEPAGGYAGLVLDNYRFGDLRLYLMGEQQDWPGERVPLLGCDCGEWGCWPLVARVSHEDAVVRWDEFRQPHRPERHYDDFGPFVFDGAIYGDAVAHAFALANSV